MGLSRTIHYSATTHSVAEVQETQGDQSSTGEGPSSVRSGEEGGSAEGRGPSSAEGECHIIVVTCGYEDVACANLDAG